MKRLFLCSSFADVANLFVDCAKEDLQALQNQYDSM